MFKEQNSHKPQQESSSSLAPNNVARKLSARDMALVIGRKATDAELEEYLSRPHGKAIALDNALANIKKKLQQKRITSYSAGHLEL
jgi:hypothetical protein